MNEQTDWVEKSVWKILSNVNTSMPGVIRDFDDDKMLVTIEPGFYRKYKSKPEATKLPDIHDVPLIIPKFGDFHICPPKDSVIGAEVLLVFAQRALDRFMESGEPSDPLSSRKFSLTDCFAIGGVIPTSKPLKRVSKASSLEIKYKESYLEIESNGNIKLSKDDKHFFKLSDKLEVKVGDHELASILLETITAISQITVNTMFGPVNLNNKADFDKLLPKYKAMTGA